MHCQLSRLPMVSWAIQPRTGLALVSLVFLVAATGVSLWHATGAGISADGDVETAGGPIDYSTLTGEIRIDGSSTVFPISEAVAIEFVAEAPSVNPNVAFSGTNRGFERFCNGETEINNASREITEEELADCAGNGIEDVIEVQIAIDALTLVIHPNNDFVDCLTIEQLHEIFRAGGATSWQEVDPSFPDQLLQTYYPGNNFNNNSGTRDYFVGHVIEGVDPEAVHRQDGTGSADPNVLAQGVKGDEGGIGYFGFGYYQAAGSTLKAVEIDSGGGCVAPSAETALDGSYSPFTRPLFIYTRASMLAAHPDSPVLGFVDFYLRNASEIVPAVGFIPMPDDALQEQIVKIGPYLPDGPTPTAAPTGQTPTATPTGQTPSPTPSGQTGTPAPTATPPVDGKIVFTSDRDGNHEIYVMNANGGAQTRLTFNDATDAQPVWSPDGQKIAFASDRDDPRLGNCPAFVGCDYQIYVMNADGSNQTRITNEAGANASYPAWSNDGEHIAFSLARPPDVLGEIWYADVDGSGMVQVTDPPDNPNFQYFTDSQPAWSPDDQQLTFTGLRSGMGFGTIYTVNIDGSELGALFPPSAGKGDVTPDWSPDGNRILYSSSDDDPGFQGSALYVRELYPPFSNVPLTGHNDGDFRPGWSPDGTQITFDSDRDGNHEIYVMNADGAAQTNLTNNPGNDTDPDWAPGSVAIDPRSGDTNGDGVVNALDAVEAIAMAYELITGDPWTCDGNGAAADAGGQGDSVPCADVDCDDDVDVYDALKILLHVAGFEVNLPEGCPPIGT